MHTLYYIDLNIYLYILITQTETESSSPEADPRVYDFSSATARRCMIQEKTAHLDAAAAIYVCGICVHM